MATLGLNWLPLRSLSVGTSLSHQWRTSTDPFFEFDTTIASVNASLMF
jgi:hypothetical protein